MAMLCNIFFLNQRSYTVLDCFLTMINLSSFQVVHCIIRACYINRVELFNRVHQVATKILSVFRSGIIASFSLSWLQALPNRTHRVFETGFATEDIDSSTSSSFDSVSPYNLRQRKPGTNDLFLSGNHIRYG